MTLQELEVIRFRYLRKFYEVANSYNPVNPYGVSINIYEVGNLLSLSHDLAKRIVIELVDDKMLSSSLGLKGAFITRYGVESLKFCEGKESSQGEYEAYYLAKEQHDKLTGRYAPPYQCYLKISVITRYTPEVFDGNLLIKRDALGFVCLDKINGRTSAIIRDIENNIKNLFTFDGTTFYEIQSFRINGDHIYEFTFKKYKSMQDNTEFDKIRVENSPNTIVQIQNNSSHSRQESHWKNELSLQQGVTELKENLGELTRHLTSEHRKDLIIAVDYLESQVKNQRMEQVPLIVNAINDILKAIPVETISSILSGPLLKLLGL